MHPFGPQSRWAAPRQGTCSGGSRGGFSLGSSPRPRDLRDATEDDVIAALEGSYVGDVLQGIAPDVLLEFWGLMLNHMCGEQDD